MKLTLKQVQNILKENWPQEITTDIVAYSQRNEKWRNHLMINRTVGSVGCAITCCAMLATQFDKNVTPASLNSFLRNNSGYTNDNCIYWAKLSEFVPQIKFRNYYTWRNSKADINLVLSELKNQPVLLQVDFYPGGYLNSHFVLATHHENDDIAIIDPWDGSRTKLLQRYAVNGWSLERAIYAMVLYTW
jgi:ABC-type bacteriocin/lantibiotic exporter with double-glycine peptidase domain